MRLKNSSKIHSAFKKKILWHISLLMGYSHCYSYKTNKLAFPITQNLLPFFLLFINDLSKPHFYFHSCCTDCIITHYFQHQALPTGMTDFKAIRCRTYSLEFHI